MTSQRGSEGPAQSGSPSQWIKLAMVYLLIPLLLLICGGDPGWWQAWLYALLIVGLGIGGRMWAELRHPGLTAERQNSENLRSAKAWDKVLAPLMAVSFSYPLVIVAGLDHRYAWSPEFPPWLNVVGFIWIAIGYSVASWAVAENQFFYSMVLIRTDRGHVVCDSGPYRFVRHPAYAGNVIALPGLVLALDSLWALLPAAAALVVTVTRTALEDRTLQEELPGYRNYARRVRNRLIPGLY
jgi:protein-S-isoprenylcysteine O-methyltransferase Ste14